MTENQRLKILMDKLGFATQSKFADALDMKQGGLSDVMREKVGVSNSIKSKLEKEFGVNRAWLESGKGEMFSRQPSPSNEIELSSEKYIQLLELRIKDLESLVELQKDMIDMLKHEKPVAHVKPLTKKQHV